MVQRYDGSNCYVVKEAKGALPTGDIIHDPDGWVFWPSVYRRPITLRLAGEILHTLENLNRKNK